MQNRREDLVVPKKKKKKKEIMSPTPHHNYEAKRAYLPSDVQLIVAHKVRMVTVQSVKDQTLIRLRDLLFGKATLVCEVHLDRDSVRVEARHFGVKLHVD